MDIKKYLASGVLELYVLDRLSDSDRLEVELNAAKFPQIAEELSKIELALEALALELAPDVNPDILEKTLKNIRAKGPDSATSSPAPPAAGSTGLSSFLPWLVAIGALLTSASLLFTTQNTNEELALLEEQYATLQQECDDAATERTQTTNILAALSDPGTQNILLNGTDNAPEKQAVIFYNSTKEQTLFTASNLPTPPTGKQYQLWAIDASGPKSLGVLDLDLDGSAVLPVDFFPDVAAFAITLEDLGGKPEPDLSQLQVIGEVT